VLEAVLSLGHTLVTTDRDIHTDHAEHFPASHAGVVIVATNSESRTLTTRRMMQILAEFKRSFPDWHRTSLQNSVIEITENGIQVWRVTADRMERLVHLEFRTADWCVSLVRELQRNAEGTSIAREQPDSTCGS